VYKRQLLQEERLHPGKNGVVTFTVDELETESPFLPDKKREHDLLYPKGRPRFFMCW